MKWKCGKNQVKVMKIYIVYIVIGLLTGRIDLKESGAESGDLSTFFSYEEKVQTQNMANSGIISSLPAERHSSFLLNEGRQEKSKLSADFLKDNTYSQLKYPTCSGTRKSECGRIFHLPHLKG